MRSKKNSQKISVAIGIFDGVHLGHLHLIARAHRVLTFNPHPVPGTVLLTTLEEKKALIGNLDVLKFNKRFYRLTPENFVKKDLLRRYDLEKIYVGADFRFGYKRSGDTKTLKILGKKYGFDVEVVPLQKINGKVIKSSLIRQLIGLGKITEAAKLLGREYYLMGKVVHGSNRGHKLGFPTINIKSLEGKCLPKLGVYAGDVVVKNHSYSCGINVGIRPTFNDSKPRVTVEANLVGYSGGSLYGQKVLLRFKSFIRPEQKFKDIGALVRQIKKDMTLIKKLG